MSMEVAGRRFTVVGAGRSGVAASNALARRGGDVQLVEARTDAERPAGLDAGVAFVAGTNAPRAGDVAVLSPGIPEVSPVRGEVAAAASEVLGEVELFWRLSPAPVAAITGTDGKSTTTTMLGAIVALSGRPTFVGGNLGNPLCEGLDALGPDHLVVAEVSCFQLTTCDTFRPQVAIVTNIAEDHLDYHGGFEPYQAAKRRIWQRMGAGDTVILNGDDPFIAAWPLPQGPAIQRFSLTDTAAEAHLEAGRLVVHGEALMSRARLPLPGGHNVQNALAAALAAHALGIPAEVTRRALMAYQPLAHRLQPVPTEDGLRWVDDSKATNPNAAAAGIRAIDGGLILLCGGSSKDADFAQFGALVRERARLAICYGQTREALAQAIGGDRAVVVETLAEAVAHARAAAVAGDTVLLGPACASFDQFKSYGHRGDVFRALVRGEPVPA
ncbi:MAG: UDP-N-acetylmuramoyl-L-alanine--D-glutamate ligase [Deltaproteobacteria bacterium]|nr:UDP-N-acetylmuramoyl-L-alanine--D-glutamate ligase [Deltaproteobacteria bacterium]